MTEYLKSMLIDVRDKVTKHPTRKWNTRNLSTITTYAVHHSGGSSGNAFAYADYHVNTRGWAGCGYHYVILPSGHIQWVGDWDTIRANVGGNNGYTIGVSMVGNFLNTEPTDAQIKSNIELYKYLCTEIPSISYIKGHNEFDGHKSNDCPAIDMNEFRKLAKGVDIKMYPVLKFGSIGEYVKLLQTRLIQYGYKLTLDGQFGLATKSAVIDFQTKNKLEVDGFVGNQTWTKLLQDVEDSKVDAVEKFVDIKFLDKNSRVGEVQTLLNKFGYNLTVDNSYGNNTKTAVIDFQKKNGLLPSGTVNEATYNKLKSVKPIEKNYKYTTSGNAHFVEIDGLELELVMENTTGQKSTLKNLMNASFVWWHDAPKNTKPYPMSALVYNGKILVNSQPNGRTWQKPPHYANGVPTPMFIIYKDGTVKTELRNSFTVEEAKNIHLALTGIGLLPVSKVGFEPYVNFSTVSYATTRIGIGYNPTTKKVILCYAPFQTAQGMSNLLEAKGCTIGISPDSGGSANFDVEDKDINRTSRYMCAWITW